MQDQLVSFKVAKLAKEKGFDIPVLNCYNENGELGDVESLCFVNYNQFKNVDGSNTNMYSAPTQSLLQKWLRDKHKIHIFVIPCEPSSYSKYKDLSVVWIYDIYKPLLVEYGHSNKGDNLLSYEQALDEGLYEALTLIKNE